MYSHICFACFSKHSIVDIISVMYSLRILMKINKDAPSTLNWSPKQFEQAADISINGHFYKATSLVVMYIFQMWLAFMSK